MGVDGSNSAGEPVELDGIGSERDSEKVDSARPDTTGQRRDPSPLGGADGVERVTVAGDGAHLDHDRGPAVPGDQVDLPVTDYDIAATDFEPLAEQPPGCDSLAGAPQRCAGVVQSLSSVFSSFSTFTSRKVRTRTFSRNRAGRNMSQTHASLIVTSK